MHTHITNRVRVKKVLQVLFFFVASTLILSSEKTSAQNITNYSTTESVVSFTSIPLNDVFLSGGTADDGYINNLPIGFDFWYMGSRYTTVSVSTNGWLTLGAPITDALITNNLSTGGSPRPVIAPLWDDLDIASGGFDYLTSGVAPNRVLTLQFLNIEWGYQGTPAISFQVIMQETTGKISFVYKRETGVLHSPSASAGISGLASGQFLSLNWNGTPINVSSAAETSTLNVKPLAGQTFTFASAVPIAPTSLTFSNITSTGMTLNWAQTASNEVGFVIYRSTDGGSNFSFVSQTAANVTSSVQTGLTTGTNYHWRIYAVTEGCLSTSLAGNQCTQISASISYPASPICSGSGSISATLSGATGGTFSSSAGLSLNGATGAVNLAASAAGSYTVTYTISSSTGCATFTTTANVTINSANFSQVSNAGLIASYRFSGNANDAAGLNNGTLQGAPGLVADRFDVVGSAYNLNGSSQYITTANSYSNPNEFTVSIWFKTGTSSGGKLIGFESGQTGSSTNYDRHLYMGNSGQLYFGVYPGTVKSVNSTLSYNDNAWHRATATLSASGMFLYVDGVQVAGSTGTTSAENFAGYWRIGYGNLTGAWVAQPTSSYFSGVVDDVSIYHRALTATEISTLYRAPDGAGNNNPTCSGNSLILTGPTVSGATYSWTGPAGFTSTQQNPALSFDLAKAGVYKLVVTQSGCSATAYTRVLPPTSDGEWVGAVSSDWCNAANWRCALVPAAGAHISVPAEATFMPVMTCDKVIGNLVLNGTATLGLASATLTINGSVSGTGTLVGSLNGSLVIGGASGDITLRFAQTNTLSRTLKNYTQTRPSVVTLASPLEIINLVSLPNNGSTLASEGFLTLKSSESAYAQLGSLSGTSRVTGNVNVQSFITGKLNALYRGNRMISSPVVDNASPTIYEQLKSSIVITGPGGVINGFDAGGSGNPNAVTLTTYAENLLPFNSFVAEPSITTRVLAGRASFIFFRGDRTNSTGDKVNAPYGKPQNVVVNYRGVVNQGAVSIPTYHSNRSDDNYNGFNALGNPYPAAIDWEKVYASNSSLIANEIRVIKPGGGMMTRKDVSGTIVVLNADAAAAQYIQPGQGFYIKKTAAGTSTFSFLESHKATSNAAERLLSLPEKLLAFKGDISELKDNDSPDKTKSFRISIEQNELRDETVILFSSKFSPVFDDYDAAYMSGNTVLIGSLTSDDKVASINALPEIKGSTEVKLYVSSSLSGNYKLNFSELSMTSGFKIFLVDALFPGKRVAIKKQPIYEFSMERTNLASYGANRFKLVFEAVEPAVIWSDFIVHKISEMAALKWATRSETNTQRFYIERSGDGVNYSRIGEVRASGNSSAITNYSFIDKSPLSGLNTYRISQINDDEDSTFSNTAAVSFGDAIGNEITATAYPNPSINHVDIFSGRNYQSVQLRVLDASGRIVMTKKVNNLQGNLAYRLNTTSWDAGIYVVECKDLMLNKVAFQLKILKL